MELILLVEGAREALYGVCARFQAEWVPVSRPESAPF
jgi:hypothetical protein